MKTHLSALSLASLGALVSGPSSVFIYTGEAGEIDRESALEYIAKMMREEREREEQAKQDLKLVVENFQKMDKVCLDVSFYLDETRGSYEQPAQQPFYMGVKKNRKMRKR